MVILDSPRRGLWHGNLSVRSAITSEIPQILFNWKLPLDATVQHFSLEPTSEAVALGPNHAWHCDSTQSNQRPNPIRYTLFDLCQEKQLFQAKLDFLQRKAQLCHVFCCHAWGESRALSSNTSLMVWIYGWQNKPKNWKLSQNADRMSGKTKVPFWTVQYTTRRTKASIVKFVIKQHTETRPLFHCHHRLKHKLGVIRALNHTAGNAPTKADGKQNYAHIQTEDLLLNQTGIHNKDMCVWKNKENDIQDWCKRTESEALSSHMWLKYL